jgi:hypothetical protein
MRLTVSNSVGDVASFELEAGALVDNVRILVEVEMGIPCAQQEVRTTVWRERSCMALSARPRAPQLLFCGRALDPAVTLSAAGVGDGDMIYVRATAAAAPPAGSCVSRGGAMSVGDFCRVRRPLRVRVCEDGDARARACSARARACSARARACACERGRRRCRVARRGWAPVGLSDRTCE